MNKPFGVVSRADLVRLQEQKCEAETVFIAQQLGLKQDLNYLKPSQPSVSTVPDSVPNEKPEIPSQAIDRSAQLNPWFWYLAKRDWHDEHAKPDQASASSYEAWRNRPPIAEHTPLYSKQAIITRVLPLLRQTERGRKPDLVQVVKTLSRAEPLRTLPREQRQAEHAPLVIVVDRSRHLIPYWQDQTVVIQMLQQLGYQDAQLAVLVEGEAVTRLISEQGTQDWSVPQGALVVLLSDLGALQQQGRQEQIWLQLGRLLKHQNNTLIALLPCAVQRLNTAVQRLVQGVSVAHESTDVEWEQQQADLLLTVLAPCIRIEPSLLRDMRLKVAVLGEEWCMAASIEALVWQHGALAEAHSVAASWNSETRKAYLQRFAELSDAVKTLALDTIRAWRGAVSENIWYEELLSLDTDSQQLAVIQGDMQQAVEKLHFIVQQAQTEVISAELDAYYRRLEQRVPEECVTRSAALQQIIGLFGIKQHLIDPQNVPIQGAKRKALLYQRGTRLFLCAFDPFKPSSVGMSPLAIVQLRSDSVQVCDEQGRGLGVLSLGDHQGFELGEWQALQIRSEVEVLHLSTRQAPENCEMGRDGYGLYVDLDFFGVVQRFRWIPAGRFMMGSPEDEVEREPWAKETLHEVTLTTGFWLADTTCTQALWQAVMGENPALFTESDQQPVEQVSWLGVHQFLSKLSEAYPTLQLGLPTEAQWEYACRAGTTTPFSFGETISSEQVNYDGNRPYANGAEGRYREKTVAVKSLPANAWGLYEMHGNVWEWCVDERQGDLGSASVINSAQVQTVAGLDAGSSLEQTGLMALYSLASVSRVLRGGSWYDRGGYCRSAIRDVGAASPRSSDVGFRFFLGHELKIIERALIPTKEELKIVDIFRKNVFGKIAEKDFFNNDGSEGRWLETQMGVFSNLNLIPDLSEFEIKASTSGKTTFGDWAASYYIYNDPMYVPLNKKNRVLERRDQFFIRVFGIPNEEKGGRYFWVGRVIPKIDCLNEFGTELKVDEDDNILIEYHYSKDQREGKADIVPLSMQKDHLVIVRWDADLMRKRINAKFNQKRWFFCKKDEHGVYKEIRFGEPMSFEMWIELVKIGEVFFDSGMYEGNNRPYSQWRANNSIWEKLVVRAYPPFPN